MRYIGVGKKRSAALSRNDSDTCRAAGASAVIVSHAVPLPYGTGTPQPRLILSGGQVELGMVAVLSVVVISGSLVTRSYDRTPQPLRLAEAGFPRVLPSLQERRRPLSLAGPRAPGLAAGPRRRRRPRPHRPRRAVLASRRDAGALAQGPWDTRSAPSRAMMKRRAGGPGLTSRRGRRLAQPSGRTQPERRKDA